MKVISVITQTLLDSLIISQVFCLCIYFITLSPSDLWDQLEKSCVVGWPLEPPALIVIKVYIKCVQNLACSKSEQYTSLIPLMIILEKIPGCGYVLLAFSVFN